MNEEKSESYKKHLISKAQMDILSQEYENNNYSVVNKSRNPNTPDAKAVYFDLEVLEGYLQYVKREALAKGEKIPKIKICFGQYPKEKKVDDREDDRYKGYQTLFLQPVSGDQGFQEKLESDASQKTEKIEGSGSDSEGLNFGMLRPPY